ncbi:hypothetical protein [Sphingobacterium yanglingense]|uniref:Uncharacterized protein n=1 Tax=Sphingobacterium yanglingense TaxID=1437280 RepID=A0A4R6WJH6_9SPHI|nr:hypothetical protein [Sphingobacterium yanglingense]TDQ79057.1 hypothetical protein CLV99_0488 [Sphingobacterium yanglingense]
MRFEDLYWHDSIIKNVTIDRTRPGYQDTIVFDIDWYDTGLAKLVFEEVSWAQMEMNFGIVCHEAIDTAFEAPPDDTDLVRFTQSLLGLENPDVSCYVIRTSSTGSVFKIIAKRFRLWL